MFFDDRKLKKVDLGNKKVISKDEFMKKIKEDKIKDVQKQKIQESNKILARFFHKLKLKMISEFKVKEMINNINSIITILEKQKEFNKQTQEKIILNTIDKILSDLIIISYSIIPSNLSYELINNVLNILSFLSREKLFQIDQRIFICLVNLFYLSIFDLYKLVHKNNLVNRDSKVMFFKMYEFFISNDQNFLNQLYFTTSNNTDIIFQLNYILSMTHKIIDVNFQGLLLKFSIEVNEYNIISNKIYDEFSNRIIICFVNSGIYLKNDKEMFVFNLLNILNKAKNKEFIYNLSDEKLILLLNEIDLSITVSKKKNRSFGNGLPEFITIIFNQFRKKDVSISTLDKYSIDRKRILVIINNILEYIFEYSNNNTISIDSLILLAWSAGKLIVHLYTSNFEKTELHSVLDYIFNKIIIRYNNKIIDDILKYSIDLIYQKKEVFKNYKLFKKQLEIIAFAVINRIEYKDNYIFVDFRGPQDITQNLPFNYMYLNTISKMLIELFSILINKKNLQELEKLKSNIIIRCLKSLFNLDVEIEFSYNRETFWSNMELISKITSFSPEKQIESIKIMPFIFPFTSRLTVLYRFLSNLKKERIQPYLSDPYFNPEDLNLVIRRNTIFDDTLSLYLNDRLKPYVRWHITFINELGIKEEGVDAGGLFKEFIYKLSEVAFNQNIGFFKETNMGFLMPNTASANVSNIHLKIYEFLGFIVGISMIEDIKIWPNFSPFFLNDVIDVENSFIELKNYDSELYKNLVSLKSYEGDIENDFSLNFTIIEENNGKSKFIELIENGVNINVDNNNKLLYIKKVAQYKLYYQFKNQIESFKRGLCHIIDEDILKLFTADELRQLITGFDKPIDIIDLKLNTRYELWNFNNNEDLLVLNNFWEILNEFDDKEKEKLLFFVTSLKRPPLSGFKSLRPQFTISKSSKTFPTASTCSNMLLLPVLPKNKLKEVLKYAINADAGFYYG